MAATATQQSKSQSLNRNHRSDDRRLLPLSDDPQIAIGELREKLLGHLRQVADRMKIQIVPPVDPSPDSLPWNLRRKRASRNEIEQSPCLKYREKNQQKNHQKFSVSLTREEIDEDFFSLTGSRPRRRPKKRPKIIQRQIDAIFPGLFLSEITPESYRVPE